MRRSSEDPRWQEPVRGAGRGLRARDDRPWASSSRGTDDHPSKRRICGRRRRCALGAGEHGYARPVENLVATWTSTRWRSSTSPTTASSPLPRPRQLTREPWIFDGRQRPVVQAVPRRRQADRDHAARGPASRSTGTTRELRRSGTCASASRRARVSSWTGSATTNRDRARHHRAGLAECMSCTGIGHAADRGRATSSSASGGWRTLDARMRLRRTHPVLRRHRRRSRTATRHNRGTRSACSEDTGIA